jgi:hypothetical protein
MAEDPTTAARIQSQVRFWEICGRKIGTGAGFLRVLSFSPPNYSTSCSISIYRHNNRPCIFIVLTLTASLLKNRVHHGSTSWVTWTQSTIIFYFFKIYFNIILHGHWFYYSQSHETVNYGHESRGTRNEVWLCWGGPAAIYSTDIILPSVSKSHEWSILFSFTVQIMYAVFISRIQEW